VTCHPADISTVPQVRAGIEAAHGKGIFAWRPGYRIGEIPASLWQLASDFPHSPMN
jgi:hypothetical protein